MSKVKTNYEAMFVIDPDIEAKEENAIANLVAKFKSFIEANAENVEIEEWGMRKLAYPINYIPEGYYVLMNFSADSNVPAELERNYRIVEDVMRHVIIRKDA